MNDKKEYYVINRFNGAVHIVVSRNRWKAMEEGRKFFGSIPLDLYAR